MDRFLSCPYNLAADRQTRMLADLTRVGCYNASAMPASRRRATMIADAKSNLRRLAFFGLTERQVDTGYLFERRFGIRFRPNVGNGMRRTAESDRNGAVDNHGTSIFEQYNSTRATDAAARLSDLELRRIRAANELDIELYDYARQLFDRRLHKARVLDRRRTPSA